MDWIDNKIKKKKARKKKNQYNQTSAATSRSYHDKFKWKKWNCSPWSTTSTKSRRYIFFIFRQ